MNNKRKIMPIVLSGSYIIPTIGVATVGAGLISPINNIAHAAESNSVVQNAQVTSAAENNTTINTSSYYNLKSTWTVAKGAKSGDTTELTLPPKAFFSMGDAPIKDKDGNVIANMTVVDNAKLVVTYTDYVETHKNVNITIDAVILNFNKGVNQLQEIIDGKTYDLNKTLTISTGSSDPNTGSLESPAFNEDTFGQYHIYFDDKTPLINQSDNVKTIKATYTIDKSVQPYAEFDCDNTKWISIGGNENSSQTDAKMNFQLDDCSPTELNATLTIPADFGDKIVNEITFNGIIKVTDQAQKEQHIFPYIVNSKYNINGKEYTHDSIGGYAFQSVSGSGELKANAIANDDKYTTPFNTPLTFNELSNDTISDDAESWNTVNLVNDNGENVKTLKTTDGTYNVNDNNTITFTPANGFTGKIKNPVSYIATDSNGKTATATISITVDEPTTPTANPDTNTTSFNTPINTNILTNDKVNQDGATWSKVQLLDNNGNPVNTLTNSNGTYTVKSDNSVDFTPAIGFSGNATAIKYRATDSNGKTADSTLTITVADALSPAAADDKATTPFNTPITITPLNNDTLSEKGSTWKNVDLVDVNGKPVKTIETTDGIYKVNADNTVTFTPFESFTGTIKDPVPYVATDSNGKTATATITVTVGAPQAPMANPDTNKTDYGKSITTNVLTNDTLGEQGSTWKSVDLKGKDGKSVKELTTTDGKYVVNKDNTVTFTPATGFTGTVKEPVTYIATDSNGKSAESTLTITVGAKPVTPVTPVTPVKPKPVVTPTKPVVVGPTVQTDILNGDGTDATGIAGVAAIAGLFGAGIIGARRKK